MPHRPPRSPPVDPNAETVTLKVEIVGLDRIMDALKPLLAAATTWLKNRAGSASLEDLQRIDASASQLETKLGSVPTEIPKPLPE